MKAYTIAMAILFLVDLWAMHSVTGRINGIVGILEAALLPGLIWLLCFALHGLYLLLAKLAPPDAKQSPPTTPQ